MSKTSIMEKLPRRIDVAPGNSHATSSQIPLYNLLINLGLNIPQQEWTVLIS